MYGNAGVSKARRHALARRSMQSKLVTVCWAQWRSTGHKYVPPAGAARPTAYNYIHCPNQVKGPTQRKRTQNRVGLFIK